jgi:hypothetical protein
VKYTTGEDISDGFSEDEFSAVETICGGDWRSSDEWIEDDDRT